MRKLLDRSTTTKFSKKTHKPEEEVDNYLFLEIYSKTLIGGWRGLKTGYLKELLPKLIDCMMCRLWIHLHMMQLVFMLVL